MNFLKRISTTLQHFFLVIYLILAEEENGIFNYSVLSSLEFLLVNVNSFLIYIQNELKNFNFYKKKKKKHFVFI